MRMASTLARTRGMGDLHGRNSLAHRGIAMPQIRVANASHHFVSYSVIKTRAVRG
jgi:hypothetical protein